MSLHPPLPRIWASCCRGVSMVEELSAYFANTRRVNTLRGIAASLIKVSSMMQYERGSVLEREQPRG